MKTVEELKGMTQEDLVRLVQELQDENKKLSEDKGMYFKLYSEHSMKNEKLTSIVKDMSSLI